MSKPWQPYAFHILEKHLEPLEECIQAMGR